MKKSILTLLSIGLLSIASNAAECKPMLTPSDFQLDSQLKAQNESYEFSIFGNFIYSGIMLGYTQSIFCQALINNDNDIEKYRSCVSDIKNLTENDSAKTPETNLNAMHHKNAKYGFKMSSQAPISKKNLCIVQNKYKTKNSLPQSNVLPILAKKQESIRQNYSNASIIAGETNNLSEMYKAIMNTENQNQ